MSRFCYRIGCHCTSLHLYKQKYNYKSKDHYFVSPLCLSPTALLSVCGMQRCSRGRQGKNILYARSRIRARKLILNNFPAHWNAGNDNHRLEKALPPDTNFPPVVSTWNLARASFRVRPEGRLSRLAFVTSTQLMSSAPRWPR